MMFHVLVFLCLWALPAAQAGSYDARQEGAGKAPPTEAEAHSPESVLDFKVKDIDGKDVPLRRYEGDVLLIVNVASKCGLTERNYTQLEPLYEKYKKRGLRILAFPCNDFRGQEPGNSDQIKEVCRGKYKSTFDLFGKIHVKGDDVAPLYKFLTRHPNKDIRGDVQWNFQKYLVGRDGKVLAKFHPTVNPNDKKLTAAIEQALEAKRPAKPEKPKR